MKKEVIDADLSFLLPYSFYALYVMLEKALNVVDLFYSWMFPALVKL